MIGDDLPELLLVNHFDLPVVCGTTVMFDEVLRVAPSAAPGVRFAYESHDRHADPDAFAAHLDAEHGRARAVVAINAHIEVTFPFTERLFAWCLRRGVPAFVHVHDYWPHHRDALELLTRTLHARVLASSPFVAASLAAHGFSADLLEVGIPLPEPPPAPRPPGHPPVIASVGRLVARKCLPDVVHGFAESGLDGEARLYLRALPGNVFGVDADRRELALVEAAIAERHLRSVEVDLVPADPPEYAAHAAYVCASFYEGFSMPVLEAAYQGCPPIMSAIPPHERSARLLFGDRAGDFLFPVGDHAALGALLRDEVRTGRRRALLHARLDEVRATIRGRFSLDRLARELGARAAPPRAG